MTAAHDLNDEPELESIWHGTFNVLGVDLDCHVLSDGSRIIEQTSLNALMEKLATKGLTELDIVTDAGALEFARWQRGLPISDKPAAAKR
jgi:hypothetical protein